MIDRDEADGPAPTTYYDRIFEIDAAKILPGEYFVTQRDMVVVTVLGSCVSACLRDRISGFGGMNHFMLPGIDGGGPVCVSARYGVHAMEILVNRLLKLGAQRSNLEAKVFGGGNVLRGFVTTTVGERNAEFVLDYLETEGIRLVSRDLLGVYPRKVYFFPKTGRVLVRKLKSTHNNTIALRERDYASRLKLAAVDGGVELF
ncbi:MAG: cheD [Proteobacteria bacterium]|nr:cheD [Pseudomonadota bacterium]